MVAFTQENKCKNCLGNLAKFSFLLFLLVNSEGCGAAALGKNFEHLSEMIRIDDPMELRSAGRNQWKEVHQHPVFQRYHGLGADFSARGYPIHTRDFSDGEAYPVMEVIHFSIIIFLSLIMIYLNHEANVKINFYIVFLNRRSLKLTGSKLRTSFAY